jgi:nitrite reductase/ring-hydroxylating ferredoxin subunit
MSCSRREFLAVGGALVVSRLGGCGRGGHIDGEVAPANGLATLTFAQFPQLSTVGDGVVVDAGGTLLVVIRTGDTTAAALSAECTHEGCTVEYVGGDVPIHCPCHDSTFAQSGQVVSGPARTSLRNYTATVGSDGVTVTL